VARRIDTLRLDKRWCRWWSLYIEIDILCRRDELLRFSVEFLTTLALYITNIIYTNYLLYITIILFIIYTIIIYY